MNDSIESAMIALIESFRGRLPDDFLNEAAALASSREWGVALENICVQLYELDALISTAELAEIDRIASDMNMEKTTWDFLLPRLLPPDLSH